MQASIEFINSCLAGMNLHVHKTTLKRCSPRWGREGFVPVHNRLFLITDGEGYVRIGNDEYFPRAGQLLIFPAGVPVTYRRLNDNVYMRYFCEFSAQLGARPLFDVIRVNPCMELQSPEELYQKFDRLIVALEERSHKVGAAFLIQSIMLDILWTCIGQADIREIRMEESVPFEQLQMLLQYIDDRLHEKITVEELAELLHYHPNYFYRVFKRLTGSTPNAYILNRRMERAKQLLLTTRWPVKEIAEAAGMELHYFSAQFKRYAGCSASEFRKHDTE